MNTTGLDEFRLRVEEAPDDDVRDMLAALSLAPSGGDWVDRVNVLCDECLVRGLRL